MSKIIIIGAGAAGLSAAVRLFKNGIKNVTILEASERIGGRINTELFCGEKIDLGAQWCHGEESNIVYEMVSGMDLLAPSEMYWDNQILISNGTIVPKDIVLKLEELYKKMIENDPEMATSESSLGEFLINKYNLLIAEPPYQDIDRNLAIQYLDWCHKFENSIDGSDSWWQSSAQGYLQYHECPGHPILNWKGQGYDKFLQVLLGVYPNACDAIPLDILYSKEVTSINWERSSEASAALVTCQDGTTYEADYVIVTVSLGVLKNGNLAFEPPLPDYKTRCIKHLGFGVVDKIYLKFDQLWWIPDWNGMKLLWDENDKKEMLEKDRSESWILDLFGFYTVDDCPDLLCGWVSGPSARIMEQLTDQEVLVQCGNLLRRFVERHRVNRAMIYKDPCAIKRSFWYQNPLTRGSYSFRTVTTESRGASAAQLATPLTNSSGREVILFAGEATSDHYYSTVHGAVGSGFREADRILNKNIADATRFNKKGARDVLIIGAGVAGLSAAHKLLETSFSKFFGSSINPSKFRVKILEAKSRAGGRIHSVDFGDSFIESGAQWLHGSENHLYKIADHFELLSDELSDEGLGIYINEKGDIIEEDIIKKVDFVVGEILQRCEEFAESDISDYPVCVKDFMDSEFEKYLKNCVNDNTEIRTIKRRLYEWHERFQVIDNSCASLRDLSAKAWGKYSFEGNDSQAHINFKKGYVSLIDRLCDELPDDTLQFNKEICLVEWSDNGAKITCKDNSVYEADFVIITVSLGVLKRNQASWFRPNLPKNVTQAIEDMGFGTINKIFLQFDEAWWNEVEGFQFVWFEDDSKCDLGEPSSWVYDLSGFDVLYPGAENTLVGWVGAMGALLIEQRSERQISEDCVQLLSTILKIEVPEPIRVFRSKWNSDPHFLGSYSHTTPLCDKRGSGWKDLSTPILDKTGFPRILLAGEACSEQFFSTTHGAMKSGIEQAEVLLNFIR